MVNRTLILIVIGVGGLFAGCATSNKTKKDVAQSAAKTAAPAVGAPVGVDTSKLKKPAAGITDKVKASKRSEGLFRIYQDTATGSVQLYIRKDQLNKEFIYQSFSLSGPTSLFLNQSMHRANFIFSPRKSYDKIELAISNTNFYYDEKNPVSKSKNVDKTEAVFLSEKVVAEDSTGYLIAADGLFISEKLDAIRPVTPPGPMSMMMFNLGQLNPSKSKVSKVRSYPDNTDVIVDLAYDNPMPINGGGIDITDARYNRIRMQHSFLAMPTEDFKPRRDDPRVGYFSTEVNNLTSTSSVPYKDMINRWKLVKKDPAAAISEPVEPIVYWIENTTPLEYRDVIMEAGLKWNEAFEKAGFRNAVQMKIMPDTATWDPADIRYNVIRWVSSPYPSYGAIGPSFVNPRTSQILGSDITVEWFSGSATPIIDELLNGKTMYSNEQAPELKIPHIMSNHLYCSIGEELKAQYSTGLTVLEAHDAPEAELREMHKQFLIYLIMHEMGHTLGLNHNMKASQMLSPAELNNKEITRKIGLIGSVMDYPAINVPSDRSKQGDFYTTKAGPYDLWAIEYGYSQFADGQEEVGLNRILSKSTDPKLIFGNDADDMRSPGKAIDPRVQVNDLSSDAIAYAEDRFKLVNDLMGKLVQKYSKPGQSYAELRARYNMLNGQRSGMIAAVSRYVGGVYIDRSYPDQKSGNKPFTPVPVATQKKAMEVLKKNVFAPDAFSDDAQVYPYLQMQRRGFNFFATSEDYKITGASLNLQTSALAHILHPVTLQRISNSRLYGNTYSVVEVMSDLSSGIFDADLKGDVNVQRQYLQTAFVKGAASIIDPKTPGFDDVARAGALQTLKGIRSKLNSAGGGNAETRAHRANLQFIIENALDMD
jgi:Met-zincin/Domain of unknown function (DUF5117)